MQYWTLFLVCLLSMDRFSNAQVCGPRIRKAWDRLTPVEQDRYQRVVQKSMDDSYFIKFVEIHTNHLSEMQAHRTCVFLFWHRRFITGFENMLRSYGGEFACVTIPYWDYVTQSAAYMNGSCKNMLECAPILRGLGGIDGTRRIVNINTQPVDGQFCANHSPMNAFCESSKTPRLQCAHCVPRGNWAAARFPPECNYASIYQQLFTGANMAQVTRSVEYGVHNSIHSVLGGAMSYLQSPADIIFYSHHATIDLIQTIYVKCLYNNAKLSNSQKAWDPKLFFSCPTRDAKGSLMPGTLVDHQSGQMGYPSIPTVDPKSPLYPFFKDLPNQFYQFVDAKDIGPSSYTYEIQGLLGRMYQFCKAAPQPARRLREGCYDKDDLEPVIIESIDPLSVKQNLWYNKIYGAAKDVGLCDKSSAKEVEKITCMFYNECRQGVEDYTEVFRQHWTATNHTVCSQVILDIKSGATTIQVPNWRDLTAPFFNCNKD